MKHFACYLARDAKFQGMAVLQIVIQPDGHATDIQVVKDPGLAEQAVETARTWRFKDA